MSWKRVGQFVLRRPVATLVASLAVLVPPTFAVPALRTSYDQLRELPASADSVRGFDALEGSFEPGEIQPLIVMVRSRRALWNDESFEALDDLTVNLGKVRGVTRVRSITRPTGGGVTEAQIQAIGLGDVDALTSRLPRAIRGIDRLVGGLERMRSGLVRIRASVPQQRAGISQGAEGIEAMREGLERISRGLRRLRGGLARAESAVRTLARRVAEPA
ncbi:MAG TPA: hypothetical protein VG709_08170, partial [Actinomycetota bacterium]|nr:hypothetical protein [Actinomycetota bacterium]